MHIKYTRNDEGPNSRSNFKVKRKQHKRAVYTMMVDPCSVFYYTNELNKEEIVINPYTCTPAKWLATMPEVIKPK